MSKNSLALKRSHAYDNKKTNTSLIRLNFSVLLCACFLFGSQVDAQSILSDDFDRANLDSGRWTFINPLDDGSVAMTGTDTNDAYLELSVPAGPTHDPWQSTNRAVRVMQAATDEDFEIDTSFASEPDPNEAFQLQGIIVEQDTDNWLRFDLHSDGSGLSVYASSTLNGASSQQINIAVNPGDASYLRVNRTGDDWVFSYSADGATWFEAGSFTHSLAVDSIGPFAANHGPGGINAPAYTAQLDYFFNTATPIVAEDNGAEVDTWAPLIHTNSTLGGGTTLTVNWYTDEPAIGAVDFGPTTAYGTTETELVPVYYHAVTITGLIPGNTYNYRIRSEDDLGHEATSENYEFTFDPAGPTIDVWYGDTQDFGLLGNPQEFYINIPGNVSDPDGVSSLSYTLDGGTPVNLTIGPDGRRLENAGDFNIDPDWTALSDGVHTVEITATDNAGNTTFETVTVNYTGGNIWSFPYTADWSSLTTDADPATPDPAIQTLAQVVDGKWSVDNGVIRTVEPGYDRLVALGDHLSDDYEALVPITIHETTGSFGVGLLFRWNGHTDTPVSCVQPECGYLPLGAIGWFRSNRIEFYNTGVTQTFSIALDTTYWMRMRVENNGANPVYYLKVWEDGQTEPAAWNLTHQEDAGSPQTGSLLLITHEADVSFGNVVITPVQGGANVPPIAMSDSRSVLTGGTVLIDVLNNDSDSDGSLVPGTVTVVGPGPANGSIDNISPTTGAITYTHNGSATSTDSFDYTVEDNDGDVSNIATVNILISDDPPAEVVSDDFCTGTLDAAWTYVDPQSDGTLGFSGATTADAWLEISVPAGPEHQLWTSGIQAPHVIQPTDNTDFEVEVKFESPVNAPRYQEQGVLIKQDDSNFMRFEIYSTSSDTTGIAAALYSATGAIPLNSAIFHNAAIAPLNTAPVYMRVKREGDSWTHSYSTDGETFSNIGTPFNHSLIVTGVGVYGANGSGGSSPAHTAKIDYFENVNSPIGNEDVCAPVELTLSYDGNGNDGGSAPVDASSPYLSGSTVTVLGPGDLSLSGHSFSGWNTQADGLGIAYAPGATFTITANTTLYAQWTIDGPGFASDDFCSGTLNESVWTWVDPLTDGTLGFSGAMTTDAWLEISVPAGPEHQLWTSGIQAPHVIQTAADTDFELEVKFESPVNAPQYQEQGVLIKQDDSNFMRFEIYSNNSNTFIIAATLPGPDIEHNVSIALLDTAPLYMRVKREGNLWTHSYSTDGDAFVQADDSFSFGLTVTGIGIYGGNGTGGSSPAHTAQFDYFENLADPIAAEDACAPVAYALTYDGNGSDGGSAPVDAGSPYAAGSTVTVLGPGDLSLTGHGFTGWNTAADGLGTSYAPGATFDITAATTLYAQWTPDQQTVSYDGNGNSGGSAPIDDNSPYDYNSTVTVLGAGDLSLTGHSFQSWNTRADGLGTVYVPGATLSITADITLYAQWSPNQHTVGYDGNGNDGGSAPVDSSSPYDYNSTVTVLGAGNLSLTGHSFDRWNRQADGLGADYAPGATFDITGDTMLYAQWINQSPVASDDEATTLEDVPVEILVLSNDNDEESETLSIVMFDSISIEGGNVSQNTSDTLNYEPAPDFYGIDSFSYQISDGYGGEDTATVTIEVLRDTDGDGVPNDDDPDDDDDGMLDLYETDNSLDPLVDDFDDDDDLDNVSNGIESLVGTDPQSEDSLPEGPGGTYVFFRDHFDNSLYADRWVTGESPVARAPAMLLESGTDIQIQVPRPLSDCDNATLESHGAIDMTTGVYRVRFAYDAFGETAFGLRLDAMTAVEVRLDADNAILSLKSTSEALNDTQGFAAGFGAGNDIVLRLARSGTVFDLYANGRFQGSTVNEDIGDLGLRPYIEARSCADDNGPVDTSIDIVEVLADNDGDGLADTFEDTNGDGVVDVTSIGEIIGTSAFISIGETDPLDADSDGDTVPDGDDNCALAENFDQRDTNDDLYGNLCDPDLTNDLVINFPDLALMREALFTADDDSDLNGDGLVNFFDLAIMRQMFLLAPGPSGPMEGQQQQPGAGH